MIRAEDLLDFAPLKVRPMDWRPALAERQRDPFRASWTNTIELLRVELYAIEFVQATLQVDVPPGMVRVNGMLHAAARPEHPGVVMTIELAQRTMVMSTDEFPSWQSNVRAIALGLQDLRRLDRYGIAKQGQQYAGFAELGDGVPMGASLGSMTAEHAARLLVDGALGLLDPVMVAALMAGDPVLRDDLYRAAAKLHHPDRGGDEETFKLLAEAKRVLAEPLNPRENP